MSFSVERRESGVVVAVDGPLSECYPEVEHEMLSILARGNDRVVLELRSDKVASIDIGALLRLYESARTHGGKLEFSCGPKIRRTLLALMRPLRNDEDAEPAGWISTPIDGREAALPGRGERPAS